MNFSINSVVFQSVFTLPSDVADKHLKLASPLQLRVILYLFRHIADGISEGKIAQEFKTDIEEITDALQYWADAGILIKTGETAPKVAERDEQTKRVRANVIKPSREEIARRGFENPKIQLLLNEAQMKFGRLLKTSEASTLVWLFDDEGMDISLILMLIEYAVSEEKCNISFIERTATEWLNNGVTSILDAEKYIADQYMKRTAWKVVEAAFGIDSRMPSTKELSLSDQWINEWKFDRKVLKLAYEKCVDAKSKFIMSYTAKILEGWHKSGYKTTEDILAAESKPATENNDFSTHDLDLIEAKLNKGYGEN